MDLSSIVEVSMTNNIVNSVRVDDWTAERAVIASYAAKLSLSTNLDLQIYFGNSSRPSSTRFKSRLLQTQFLQLDSVKQLIKNVSHNCFHFMSLEFNALKRSILSSRITRRVDQNLQGLSLCSLCVVYSLRPATSILAAIPHLRFLI